MSPYNLRALRGVVLDADFRVSSFRCWRGEWTDCCVVKTIKDTRVVLHVVIPNGGHGHSEVGVFIYTTSFSIFT